MNDERKKRLFISHTGDDKSLAKAWQTLITGITELPIEVFYAADRDPSGGIKTGRWRERISRELKEADYLLALFTPESTNRPWIFFESAFTLGLSEPRNDKDRAETRPKIVYPVVYYMKPEAVPSPLSDQQAYSGDVRDSVLELCCSLVKETTRIAADPEISGRWKGQLDHYMEQVEKHKKERLEQELFYGGFHTSETAKKLEGGEDYKWYAKWTKYLGEGDQEKEVFWHDQEIKISDTGWRIRLVGKESSGYLTPFEGVVSSEGKIALCYWYPQDASAICGTVLLEKTGLKLEGTWQGYSAPTTEDPLGLVRGRVFMSRNRAKVDNWGPQRQTGSRTEASSSPDPGS